LFCAGVLLQVAHDMGRGLLTPPGWLK
jgi:hypothetical protein